MLNTSNELFTDRDKFLKKCDDLLNFITGHKAQLFTACKLRSRLETRKKLEQKKRSQKYKINTKITQDQRADQNYQLVSGIEN